MDSPEDLYSDVTDHRGRGIAWRQVGGDTQFTWRWMWMTSAFAGVGENWRWREESDASGMWELRDKDAWIGNGRGGNILKEEFSDSEKVVGETNQDAEEVIDNSTYLLCYIIYITLKGKRNLKWGAGILRQCGGIFSGANWL